MTAGLVIEHFDPEVITGIELLLGVRLDRAAETLRQRTVENISRRAANEHSDPGEYPRTDEGDLRRSLFVESTESLTRRIGTDLEYGLWLETGTSDMAPRAYLTRTLSEIAAELGNVITTEEVPR
jgi:hypothetical protein